MHSPSRSSQLQGVTAVEKLKNCILVAEKTKEKRKKRRNKQSHKRSQLEMLLFAQQNNQSAARAAVVQAERTLLARQRVLQDSHVTFGTDHFVFKQCTQLFGRHCREEMQRLVLRRSRHAEQQRAYSLRAVSVHDSMPWTVSTDDRTDGGNLIGKQCNASQSERCLENKEGKSENPPFEWSCTSRLKGLG
jgi:hypothetical protein